MLGTELRAYVNFINYDYVFDVITIRRLATAYTSIKCMLLCKLIHGLRNGFRTDTSAKVWSMIIFVIF